MGNGRITMVGFVNVVGGGSVQKRSRNRKCSVDAGRKALLLVDHGSRRVEANEMLNEVKQMVLNLKPGVEIVETAHMELADPSISQGIDRCVELGADEIIVQPYFLAPGRHSSTDIPEMVGEASKSHPNVKITVTSPLGVHSKIGEVILERSGLC